MFKIPAEKLKVQTQERNVQILENSNSKGEENVAETNKHMFSWFHSSLKNSFASLIPSSDPISIEVNLEFSNEKKTGVVGTGEGLLVFFQVQNTVQGE